MNICQFCGNDIEDNYTGRIATYCSDKCRYNHHNKSKRVKTLEQQIIKKLDELKAIAGMDIKVSFEAISAIDGIENHISLHMPQRVYKCNECHQIAMFKPEHDEKCAYCMGKNTYRSYISKSRFPYSG